MLKKSNYFNLKFSDDTQCHIFCETKYNGTDDVKSFTNCETFLKFFFIINDYITFIASENRLKLIKGNILTARVRIKDLNLTLIQKCSC